MSSSPPPPPWIDERTPPHGLAVPKHEDVPTIVTQMSMRVMGIESAVYAIAKARKEERSAVRQMRNALIGLVVTLIVSGISAAMSIGSYRERIDTLMQETRDLRVELRKVQDRIAQVAARPFVPWSVPDREQR